MSDRTGRIRDAFGRAAEEERAALVVYTTAGFPRKEEGVEVLVALADAGADVIELGVPFSDPLADGPTIQKSSFEAIRAGVDLAWTLDLLRQFREVRATPIVLFSYLNPILDFGVDRFLREASAAGADGVLLTDVPLGADPELEATFERSPLDLVRLIAPTTRPERARKIAAHSQGFVYYISRTGVTGASRELSATIAEEVMALRHVSELPVAVGFGISRPDQAAELAAVADGVVVGSAVVDALGREGAAGGARLVAGLRASVGKGTANVDC
ncbi:MAG TPA: tryptophan synthase subunit alpha [Longimicrobiaceae bacterium]|nr:tryptophan synthase subunit alpha [Longimicrobiaceae bacterium]